MTELVIRTKKEQVAFRPGDVIEGAVGWNSPEAVRSIELRLLWHTVGKGTEDKVIVDQKKFENLESQGAAPFLFTAPEQPFSFSGKLISLVWDLEAVLRPGGVSASKRIVIAPAGREIVLGDAAPLPE